MSGKWNVGYLDDTDEVHAWPVDDLVAHEAQSCACGPSLEAVPRPDGSTGWAHWHASLDGREAYER